MRLVNKLDRVAAGRTAVNMSEVWDSLADRAASGALRLVLQVASGCQDACARYRSGFT